MRIERGLISVDLDEEEQGRILRLLVNVKYTTTWLAFETRASVTEESLAK
jgi:hypothetical protein